jgi:prenyltransferase beta subunit
MSQEQWRRRQWILDGIKDEESVIMTSKIQHRIQEVDDDNMPTLVITRSTELLEQTSRVCQHGLSNPTPPLDRTKHITFIKRLGLTPLLPSGFVGLDASRTWMMYWVLCALKLLGEDITPHRQRYPPYVSTYTAQYPV